MKKMSLVFICIFTLFNIVSVYSEQQNLKPIELIYNNRSQFAKVLIRVGDLYKMYRFRDSTFSCWKKDEAELVDEFVGGYIPIITHKGQFRYYLQDSLSISILASILDFPDYRQPPKLRDSSKAARQYYSTIMQNYHKPNWVSDVIKQLTYNTYFSALSQQSDDIKKHLQNCKEPEMAKIKLLALCNLSDKEKDSLLKDEEAKLKLDKEYRKKEDDKKIRQPEELMPFWVRVRLGDTTSRKNMFNTLKNNDNDYNKKIEAARAASMLWDDSCKIAFLNLFNRNIYKTIKTNEDAPKNYTFCYSIHDSLLLLLARHHPDEPIFGKQLEHMRNPMEYCDPPFQAGYFKEFAAWVKKIYKYDITYNGFMPYFMIDCSPDQSAIRDICKPAAKK
ncbi:MAG TPA: hypothetical protein DCO75_13040 [Fibrobacteres bacterium]|jgi:hypothetical protein|nr:hypothetical protein [Fibrobacterota bacterium]